MNLKLADRGKRLDLHLPLRFRAIDAASGGAEGTGRTLNVSGTGVGFETAVRLEVGARVALEIDLPPALQPKFGGQPCFRTEAVVHRADHREGHQEFEIGARFVGPRDA